MSELNDIRNFAQQVAEAIAAVIDIEVTIIDSELVRIVGTGKYKNYIGQKLPEDSVSGQILREGKIIKVFNPRLSKICHACSLKSTCDEFAEICYPIVLEKRVIGNIGLIAFSQEQKLALEKNEDYLINFLTKMSSLISTKVSDFQKSSMINNIKEQLDRIINNVEEGIIATDAKFSITYFNKVAQDYFSQGITRGKNIFELLKDKTLENRVRNEISLTDYIYNIYGERYVLSFLPIERHSIDAFGENLFIFRRIDELQDKEHIIRRRLYKKGHVAKYSFNHFIYKSKIFENTLQEAKQYSLLDSTILIIGESGTGKELFAQSIHSASQRKNAPFVAVNCAALPENLLESELFGYVKGAFTGASTTGKPGLFELAHRGTIFLDEIGDMNIGLQSRLLRVLEQKEVMRLGDDKIIPVDVRIIAATNKKLREKVKEGTFRDDLYYRLNVLNIDIPPLREREEDILILAENFLEYYSTQYQLCKTPLSAKAKRILMTYPWEGNVRELKSVIERIAVLSEGDSIKCQEMLEKILKNNDADYSTKYEVKLDLNGDFKDIQRQLIYDVIDNHHENKATELLGLSKTTIWRRINSK